MADAIELASFAADIRPLFTERERSTMAIQPSLGPPECAENRRDFCREEHAHAAAFGGPSNVGLAPAL
jgi:hypothetical protein